MASEIWSAILSGWPSVTDSEVNRKRSLKCHFLPVRVVRGNQGLPDCLYRLPSPEAAISPPARVTKRAQYACLYVNRPDPKAPKPAPSNGDDCPFNRSRQAGNGE